MPWPLKFLPDGLTDRPAEVGECWYMPNWDDEQKRTFYVTHQLSRQYVETWLGKRPPILVALPLNAVAAFAFCIDDAYVGGQWDPNPTREGWTVTGSPEDGTLTVSPSINCVGTFHGWLQNGVISDDVEGRRFTSEGRRP